MTSVERQSAGAEPDARAGSRATRDLEELLVSSGITADAPSGVSVSSIEYDSRRVTPGALFVAIAGLTTDGHGYVADSAQRGAAAALVERPTGQTVIPEILVGGTRRALGLVAHEFHGRPSERLSTHGITGTNGKTTTSYLVDAILREAGETTGLIGTLGYRIGDRKEPGDRTSPESLDVARMMAEMVDVGATAVTMEVSSHALALERTAGLRFDTATFTNLSRDHLDFHGTLAGYEAAKRRLFESLEEDAGKPGCAAIVNVDDPVGREIADGMRSGGRVRVISFGLADGDVHAADVVTGSNGTTARIETPGGVIDADLRLISEFNVMNALAATAVGVSQGVAAGAIAAGLHAVQSVPGRFEAVRAGQPFAVVVDYAHTPDALEKALRALAGLRPERVITVFGAGGDRDRGKRPIMGEIAARNSDIVIVTSDNPRTESPRSIIEEIVAGPGLNHSGAVIEVIEDRARAIRRAISLAAPGDVVLIAGKGHEDYQIIGTEKRHFDDREEARSAIEELLGGRKVDGERDAG